MLSKVSGAGYGGEGEVLRGTAGLLAPLVKEATVACSQLLACGDTELAGDTVDPLGRPFELCKAADGSLIDDAMAIAVGPFGTPFFVPECGEESDRGENSSERVAVGNLGFGFDAMFVAILANT